MSSVELIDKKEQLKIKAQMILDNGKKESRKLTDEESNEYNDLCKQIADIDKEMRDLTDKLNKKEIKKETMKENFSLLKAIRSIANNQALDERSQEVINQGIAEMRKSGQSYAGQIVLPTEYRGDQVAATVAADGKEVVATDKLNILAPIYQNLVLAKAGAQFMTGLVGNVSIPVYSGSTVGWEGEVDTAANGKGTFSSVELSPKRLTAYIDVSKQFLAQDGVGAENLLRNDIVRAISNTLEATILGNEAGTTKKPAGLFVDADAATLTYKGTVDMEEKLDGVEANANPVYIVSPSIKATLRTTPTDAGSGHFVFENNEINGLPAYSTSASKGIILGDFSNLVIGQWGGTDLTVDPYTQAANGCIRIVINAYFDAKPVRDNAFVTGVVTA